jgi:dihydropteroate synthase
MDDVIIVGVLNVTPDSFSDGGRHGSADAAVAAGLAMVEAGALWMDVGGESTRPGAAAVPEEEERARVLPVVAGLARRVGAGVRISIDTYKAGTARAALAAAAGATVVNDVSGGQMDPGLLAAAAQAGAAVVLGHLRGTPQTMMDDVRFADVDREVGEELALRVQAARAAGCRGCGATPASGSASGPPRTCGCWPACRGCAPPPACR